MPKSHGSKQYRPKLTTTETKAAEEESTQQPLQSARTADSVDTATSAASAPAVVEPLVEPVPVPSTVVADTPSQSQAVAATAATSDAIDSKEAQVKPPAELKLEEPVPPVVSLPEPQQETQIELPSPAASEVVANLPTPDMSHASQKSILEEELSMSEPVASVEQQDQEQQQQRPQPVVQEPVPVPVAEEPVPVPATQAAPEQTPEPQPQQQQVEEVLQPQPAVPAAITEARIEVPTASVIEAVPIPTSDVPAIPPAPAAADIAAAEAVPVPAAEAVPVPAAAAAPAPVEAASASSGVVRGSISRLVSAAKTFHDRARSSSAILAFGLDKVSELSAPVVTPVVSRVVAMSDPIVNKIDSGLVNAYQAIQTRVVEPARKLHQALDHNKDGYISLADLSADVGVVLTAGRKEIETRLPVANLLKFASSSSGASAEAPPAALVAAETPAAAAAPSEQQQQQSCPPSPSRSLGQRVRDLGSAAISSLTTAASSSFKRVTGQDLDIISYAEAIIAKVQTSTQPPLAEAQKRVDVALTAVKERLAHVKALLARVSGQGLARVRVTLEPLAGSIQTAVSPITARLRVKVGKFIESAQDVTSRSTALLIHRPLVLLPAAAWSVLTSMASSFSTSSTTSTAASTPAAPAPIESKAVEPTVVVESSSSSSVADREAEELARAILSLLAALKELFYQSDAAKSVEPETIPVPVAAAAVTAEAEAEAAVSP